MLSSAEPLNLAGFLESTLDRVAGKSDWAEALALARWVATFLSLNNLGIYRLDALETILSQRLPAGGDGQRPNPAATRPELHVASTLYAYGGHTALMRLLIQEAPHPADVLLTGATTAHEAATILHVPADRVHAVPAAADAACRVWALVDILSRYRRVVLHIHPNDVQVAVAVRLLKSRVPDVAVHLVNHSDHVFSVAVGAADRVLEISQYGWSLRERRDTVRTSTFIGIPIPTPSTANRDHEPRPAAVMLTGGASYKFRPIAGMSLPAAFGRLLAERPRFRLDVVGPKPRDWWWWPLRMRYPTRVRLFRMVPRAAYLELVRGCTVYVDSYPLPGGTALPEALMNGCLVAGIRGVAWGYSPADELLSPDARSFIAHCISLAEADPKALARQETVRQLCIQLHAPGAVRKRMDQALDAPALLEPPGSLGPPPTCGLEPIWPVSRTLRIPTRRAIGLCAADMAWLAVQYGRMRGWLERGTWLLWSQSLTARG